MGELISASSRFKRHAVRTHNYTVVKLDEHEGYLLMKLRKFGASRISLMAAVPLEIFQNHGLEKGSVIRIDRTGEIFTPQVKFAPHTILNSFEVVDGELKDEKRPDFIVCIRSDDPNHPFAKFIS